MEKKNKIFSINLQPEKEKIDKKNGSKSNSKLSDGKYILYK